MKRRNFLNNATLAGIGATASTSLLSAPALSQGRREFRLVTTWPRDFPGVGTTAQRFANCVNTASEGRINIKLFAAGELVAPFDSFDAVASGEADMYHGTEYYWADKPKAFKFFAAVPLGFTAGEMNAWVQHGGGQALWDELSADFGVKPLLCGNTGPQMMGWYNKEINELSDLKGLRIRMPGLGGDTLSELGATSVSLPAGEIMEALEAGKIDASEWIGPWNDLLIGFYKVARYYYYPGFHEPGTAIATGINLKLWNDLSVEDRAIIEDAAAAENQNMFAEYSARNGEALKTLIETHRVEIRRMDPAVYRGIASAAEDVVASLGTEGGITTKVYDNFQAFRKTIGLWTELSDQAYVEARSRYL